MKKKLLFLLFTALLLPVFSVFGFCQEPFVIDDYTVNAVINPDRSYDVTERISVRFTQQSHGIIRSIPKRGAQEEYNITNIKVLGDPFDISRGGDTYDIKIGDADRYASAQKVYEIGYTLVHAKDGQADADYVYFNAIGTQWDTQILNAAVNISFSAGGPEALNITAGAYGSRFSDGVSWSQNGSNLSIQTTRPLSAGEGITVNARFPEGTFAAAPDSLFAGTMAVSAALLAFSVFILLLCVLLYRKYGRDKKVIPVVEFFPPDGLNPAEIGMVIDRTVSARDVTSLVFYWASKGYLTISEEKKHFTLTKVKDMEPTFDLYERNAFNKLWEIGDGQSVTDKQLNLKYYQTLSATSMAITRKYKEEKNLENPKSKKMSILGFLLCAIAFAAPAAAQGLYQREAVLTVISLAFLALFCVVSYSLFTYAQEKTPKISKGASVALYMVGAVLSVVFFAVGVLVSCYSGILQTALVAPALAMAMAGVVLSAFITQRSGYGQQILERTVGFKQFLVTAEKEKLEALLEETPSYFYDILPYALVLGVSDKWAGKFDQMIHEPPQWYACGRTDTFTTIWLLNSMQHSMNRVSQSFAAAPQPSGTTSGGGFSGGGFSGGGSGGGGGSAW